MKKILIIEDDKAVRENTAEILELAGYKTATAENGKKGTQIVKDFLPDLILCDIMMPELDGYGVLQSLLKDPLTLSIPFIFLTAKTEKSEVRKGMELGADDYLTKPFEETDLLNAIETRLKKSESLKKKFSQTLQGLHDFLDQARGLNELSQLSLKKPLVNYKKKELVFNEGETPYHLFFLNKGKVKTFKGHNEGKEYLTQVYAAGDFFGYAPLLQNTSYSDSAMTLEDCEIYKIAKEDFTSLLYKNRDVAAQFIKMLSNHVTERERQLLSLAYDSVRKRVAQTLLLLAKKFQASSKKNLKVSVNREDLANMAGTATETVIRCLSELKAEQLIDIQGREIFLLNEIGLEELE